MKTFRRNRAVPPRIPQLPPSEDDGKSTIILTDQVRELANDLSLQNDVHEDRIAATERRVTTHVGPWFATDIVHSAAADFELVAGNAVTEWLAPATGQIVAVSLLLDQANSAGNLTLKIERNGSEITSATKQLDTGETSYVKRFTTQDPTRYSATAHLESSRMTFEKGDKLKLSYTTSASWAPTTPSAAVDAIGWLEVAM